MQFANQFVDERALHNNCSARTDQVCIAAPAKINLYLGVFPHSSHQHGYHKVDTLMAAVELFDWVHLACVSSARANTVAMTPSFDVDPSENIALVAADRMCDAFHRAHTISIEIEKHILPQSGLGGSSSDAAAVIRGLCALWQIDPLDDRVVMIARSIGADVAFFLDPRPSFMQGVGNERIHSYALTHPIYCALIRPTQGQSTPEAYRIFDQAPIAPASPQSLLAAVALADVHAISQHVYNNLAAALLAVDSELARVQNWIAQQPETLGCLLSGSGTAFFALCETKESADRLAIRAEKMMKWWTDSTQVLGMRA